MAVFIWPLKAAEREMNVRPVEAAEFELMHTEAFNTSVKGIGIADLPTVRPMGGHETFPWSDPVSVQTLKYSKYYLTILQFLK
ncbi:MAG: hypothetical protein ACLFS1_03585 [Opitutales bacterium]